MRKTRLLILLFPLLIAGMLWAQSDRGTITGTVTDPSGAVVPGVQVTATNVGTGIKTTAASNDLGLYSLLNLTVGNYSIAFSKPGFKTLERPAITLQIAQTLQLNITLQVGASTETVTVSEEAPLLQTQTSDTGTNLKHDIINDLPLSVDGGRRLELFAYKVTPSVEGNDWWSNVAGSQAFTKEVIIDGTSSNAQIQGDLMESTPSMDAVQEFQVQTSGVSAENGRASGGAFIFNLKSGSNRWHGNASFFLHRGAFDANTWDNGWKGQVNQCGPGISPVNGECPKAGARFADYAFSGGGPVIKNKTFFYAAFEKFSQNDFRLGALTQNVPTTAFLNGDFSALLDTTAVLGADNAGNTVYKGAIFDPVTRLVFPGNRIPPERISAVSKKIVNLYKQYYAPVGSGLTNNNALTLGNSPYQVPDELSIKVDHNFSDKNRLSTSWIYNLRPRTLVDSGGIFAPGTEDGGPLAKARRQDVVSNQWRASDSHAFSNTVLNVLSLTYNEYKNASAALAAAAGWPSQLGFGNQFAGNFPQIKFTPDKKTDLRNGWNESDIGYSQSGGYVGATYILNDSVSWVKGRHTMKFGGDFRAMQINSKAPGGTMHFDFSPMQTGGWYNNQAGFSFASMMLGAVQQASVDTPYLLYGRRKYLALFTQDDLKVTRKLTLNLGLRWETTFPFHEKYGNWANFNTTLMNPLWGIPGMVEYAGSGDVSFEKNRDWKEFGPHVGFALQVSNKVVARGSYAITYTPLGINYWFGVPYGYAPQIMGSNSVPKAGNNNPAFNWDSGYPGVFVAGTKDMNGQIPPGALWAPTSIDPNTLSQGYIHQYSFGVQYELAKDTKLDISYLGNRGRRLHQGTLDFNGPDASAYMTWYNQYGSHMWDWIGNQAGATAAGVPWYPQNQYWGYFPTLALAKFPQLTTAYEPLYYVGTPKGKSAYDALQIEVARRTGHGVALDMSYIYSKARGNVDSNFDELWYEGYFQDFSKLDQEAKVLTNYDQKHVVKGYITYELPFGHGQRFAAGSTNRAINAIVGGWKIGAVVRYNTGMPITLSVQNPYYGLAALYPDINPNADFSRHFDSAAYDPLNAKSASNRYFNPDVASIPPNGTLGAGPVRLDKLRGFGRAFEDANLMKNLSFGAEGRFRMSFRFQMYNIFNRHYFSDPNGTVCDPIQPSCNFGLVTALAEAPRQGQFDVRFQF